MKSILHFALLFLSLFLYPLSSEAAAGKYSVGGMLGGAAGLTHLGSGLGYGLRFGVDLSESFEVGLTVSRSHHFETSGKVTLTNLYGDALYRHLNFYGGLKVGATHTKYVFGSTGWDFSLGPVAGYDFALNESWSVGPSVEYLHLLTRGGGASLVNLFGVVKAKF